jgi:hypothetical protein
MGQARNAEDRCIFERLNRMLGCTVESGFFVGYIVSDDERDDKPLCVEFFDDFRQIVNDCCRLMVLLADDRLEHVSSDP